MRKNIKLILVVAFIVIGNWSCTKTIETRVYNDSPLGVESQVSPYAIMASQVVEDFDDALPASVGINQLFSSTYQASQEYTELANSSAAVLQSAGVLDSLKYYMHIDNDSDPYLVLAARLAIEMYTPAGSNGSSSIPAWISCAVDAGIGISATTLYDLVKGGTLASVGQAIKHMGIKWFASTVLKAVGKAASGVGGIVAAASFTWCLTKEYLDANIINNEDNGGEEGGADGGADNTETSNGIAVPIAFVTNSDFYDYYKEKFIAYMLIKEPWTTFEINEEFYEYARTNYGDFTSEPFAMVNEYFKSIYDN